VQAQAEALATLKAAAGHAVVLGLEHHPVITLGIRGTAADLVSPAQLSIRDIDLQVTGRGGQATLHSPGQLVIYPCINLRSFGLGARKYVELVQEATIACLFSLGVHAEQSTREPGLFVDGGKVAAFGFKIERGLTSHGLAINVTNDLSYFDLIRTCGVASQKVTRLHDHGVNINTESLFLNWLNHFKAHLF
jgi:lipoate-protein ligase B